MSADTTLETRWQRARGVIGRYPAPDERYILEWDRVDERPIHMVGVRRPLLVTWLAEGVVTQETLLDPWTGHASARADRVIEESPVEP